MSIFKKTFSVTQRLEKFNYIRKRHPYKIPIIVEKDTRSRDAPDIDKTKFLVEFDLTVGQFAYVIRKRLKMKPEQALFLFVDNVLPPTSENMNNIYKKHHDKDDMFLYITYASENTFGNKCCIL